MGCSQCQGIEELFSEEYVANELRRYHRQGPIRTTRILIESLKEAGIQGQTLLDIGGGLGAIQHELLAAGAKSAIDIEASTVYLAAARDESQRRGLSDRMDFRHGDFVDLADQLAPADIVTLDRVICCYPEMEEMVNRSAALAGRLYGLVYPRDTWWVRLVTAFENLFFRMKQNPFRSYVHATQAVEAIISAHGFKRSFIRRTLGWQVVLFAR